MTPIEQEAQSLLASVDDNEVLASTPRFGLDGIHRTSVIVEEIYLPKEQLIVNRQHGHEEVTVFTHAGPRVSNAITFNSDPEPAENLRVIRLPGDVAKSASALARLTEEMEKHKAVLSNFFDKMENETPRKMDNVFMFRTPPLRNPPPKHLELS
jgi:hypothetical protein